MKSLLHGFLIFVGATILAGGFSYGMSLIAYKTSPEYHYQGTLMVDFNGYQKFAAEMRNPTDIVATQSPTSNKIVIVYNFVGKQSDAASFGIPAGVKENYWQFINDGGS
jgi:hypothetical protein